MWGCSVVWGVGLSGLSVLILSCASRGGVGEEVVGCMGLSSGVLSSGVSVIPRLRLGFEGHVCVVM